MRASLEWPIALEEAGWVAGAAGCELWHGSGVLHLGTGQGMQRVARKMEKGGIYGELFLKMEGRSQSDLDGEDPIHKEQCFSRAEQVEVSALGSWASQYKTCPEGGPNLPKIKKRNILGTV